MFGENFVSQKIHLIQIRVSNLVLFSIAYLKPFHYHIRIEGIQNFGLSNIMVSSQNHLLTEIFATLNITKVLHSGALMTG